MNHIQSVLCSVIANVIFVGSVLVLAGLVFL